jgi:hypothetical protein
VRAGLVSDPRDYPFLGSTVYALDEILAAVQDEAVPEFEVAKPPVRLTPDAPTEIEVQLKPDAPTEIESG